ncbi:MAG: flavodoxin-dependent (E)-4-hydroxy-3-methylbut-2-enyl-diphosphate synthase [Clostridia bacterium]|nr:flavodoxin-dependent (E)-4-hydroxy-3-methylbut-2-enyl-diphosphate synthase [Clostridia bacterium]
MERKITKRIRIGNTGIGGGSPILVQSMTNRSPEDFPGTADQILSLEKAGCDIVRISTPTPESTGIFRYARERGVKIPLVADIHFDYRIALEAVKAGADKIRINPGNIGENWKIREVAECCKASGVPVRIGVNGGSLKKSLLEKYGRPCGEAIAESALEEAGMLEDCGFSDIVISVKSSTVEENILAARAVSARCDYPLHIGVTEAGDGYSGLIKNSIGIGSLLNDGIGDTIRVSLSADPLEEVKAGREILRAFCMDTKGGVEIISCPTCGRTKVDLFPILKRFREQADLIDTGGRTLKVAVMGCVVNGIGEAHEADFGIAGGDGCFSYFEGGVPRRRLSEEEAVPFLIGRIREELESHP